MKRATIRGAVVLPKGARVPSRHMLYRKYVVKALDEAERFALDNGATLTNEPPELVGTEPHPADPTRTQVVFEVAALLPDAT